MSELLTLQAVLDQEQRALGRPVKVVESRWVADVFVVVYEPAPFRLGGRDQVTRRVAAYGADGRQFFSAIVSTDWVAA